MMAKLMETNLGRALGRTMGVAAGYAVCLGARIVKFGQGKRGEPAMVDALRTLLSDTMSLYLKPGISANISYMLLPFGEEDDVPASSRTADLIARHLVGVHPKRIGVDGLPGSGKSTLARALAEQMKLEWVCLDHGLFSSAPIDLSRTGVVYEHHRLFRTQDLDAFDALIYLDEPLEIVEERIMSRMRGAAMLDFFDFEQMQAVGRKAFAMAGGMAWCVPDTHVFVKIRPPGGFRDLSRLKAELNGVDLENTESLPKEALLFLATCGQAKQGSLAYLKGQQLLEDIRCIGRQRERS